MVNRRLFSAILILALMLSVVAATLRVDFASANFMPMQPPTPAITIDSAGNVSPPSAPIRRFGNLYELTDDIEDYTLVVEKNYVIIDGVGHRLIGRGNRAGVFLQERNNVKVSNLQISGFISGVLCTWLYYGGPTPMGSNRTGNSITNCTFTNNTYGISLGDSSSGNTLSDNFLENNTHGISITLSSGNILRNNRMTNNTFNLNVQGKLQDIDTSNTVDGKPVIFWVNEQNKTVPREAGYIALFNSQGITISNFELSHNGQSILLVGVRNCTVIGNTFADNENAIWLKDSNNVTIAKNTFSRNFKDTVYMLSSNSNTIANNLFAGNGFNGTAAEQVLGSAGKAAVWLSSSSNNLIANNTMADGGEGIALQSSAENTISENRLMDNNGTAIHLFASTNNTIERNAVVDNRGIGVKIWSSDSNMVQSNLLANNTLGILLDAAAANQILENTVANSTDWGIQLKSASDSFMSSKENRIVHNNFINNQQGEGLDVGIPSIWTYPAGTVPGVGNIWDDGYAGNYWSDYRMRYPNASEVPGAGIWDQAWEINENNIDRCPLIEPYSTGMPLNVSVPETPIPSPVPSDTPSASPQITSPPQTPTPTSATSKTPSSSDAPLEVSLPKETTYVVVASTAFPIVVLLALLIKKRRL